MSASPIRTAAIVGAGPAGLFAAELLAENGVSVTVYEKMPTPGRKFLMAGRGGLNLTHTEKLDGFLNRYGAARDVLGPMVEDFSPEALRAWADGLGAETFAGSSGRVFPKAMKASPLLRAWRVRLESLGVRILTRHHWVGWSSEGGLLIGARRGAGAVRAIQQRLQGGLVRADEETRGRAGQSRGSVPHGTDGAGRGDGVRLWR
jgi:predicted flavoprotein YhiN